MEQVQKLFEIFMDFTKSGWTFSVVLIALFSYYMAFPERCEKIASHLLWLFKWSSTYMDKKYTKYDMQGRMNSFIKRMEGKIHGFSNVKIDVDFYHNDSMGTENYLDDGKYFIRVRKSTNPNRNFVNIAMAFISDNLLKDAKKQISKKQQSAIDLFVAKKLFSEEKEDVMHQFVSEFLQPLTDDDKIKEMFIRFTDADRAGLFFPIFLQEMLFLGRRVFAHPRNNKIQEEVAHLIDFLFEHSNRRIGQNMTKDRFIGEFSRFAFMIVGKTVRVENGELRAYKDYLKTLMDSGVESVYLVGNERIQDFINQVSPDDFLESHGYALFKKENYPCELKYEDGAVFNTRTYLLLIRKKNIDPFIQNEQ